MVDQDDKDTYLNVAVTLELTYLSGYRKPCITKYHVWERKIPALQDIEGSVTVGISEFLPVKPDHNSHCVEAGVSAPSVQSCQCKKKKAE